MLGTYRLALALLVASSHVGVTVAGLNPGVMAVVGFYLVSGYVMTGLIRRHYSRARNVGGFYVDRALRLFPHYLAVAGITLAWYLVHRTPTEYLRLAPDTRRLLENLAVVPLNFYMFNGSDAFTLIPPAWSLGAEIQFYLVIPFILLARGRVPALVLSLLVFAAASVGFLHTEWYGYRLLPGILFVFLLGSWLYDIDARGDARARRRLVIGVLTATAAMALALAALDATTRPYNRELLLGLALGTFALAMLGHRRRQRADDALGNLSYGVFLNHFLVLWTVFDSRVDSPARLAAFLACSLLLSVLLYALVEARTLAWRHRLRRRREARALAPAAVETPGA